MFPVKRQSVHVATYDLTLIKLLLTFGIRSAEILDEGQRERLQPPRVVCESAEHEVPVLLVRVQSWCHKKWFFSASRTIPGQDLDFSSSSLIPPKHYLALHASV
jgi:hypothetical protein